MFCISKFYDMSVPWETNFPTWLWCRWYCMSLRIMVIIKRSLSTIISNLWIVFQIHKPTHHLLMYIRIAPRSWWRHQLETFSALLVLCAGNSPVTGEFPTQSPVTRSFDVFLDLRLNKRLSKQSWGWWYETPSRSLWRHCNAAKKWGCNRNSKIVFRKFVWNAHSHASKIGNMV